MNKAFFKKKKRDPLSGKLSGFERRYYCYKPYRSMYRFFTGYEMFYQMIEKEEKTFWNDLEARLNLNFGCYWVKSND